MEKACSLNCVQTIFAIYQWINLECAASIINS